MLVSRHRHDRRQFVLRRPFSFRDGERLRQLPPRRRTGRPVTLDNCPNVELRQGAGTLTINNNPKDPSAMQLRYQVSVAQTARECSSAGGNLIIRVGVQGRIVLGPAGTSGTLEMPLRYAVVQEGPQPKTVYTKLYRVPVSIAEGQSNVPSRISRKWISVPMPSLTAFDSYVVYVGFDALGGAHPAKPPAQEACPEAKLKKLIRSDLTWPANAIEKIVSMGCVRAARA